MIIPVSLSDQYTGRNKKMLNIGVRAHDLGKLTITELSDAVSGYGFNNIQLALKKSITGLDNDFGRLSSGMGNYFRDQLHRNDINISVLGCYINPIHPDLDMRNKELCRFIEHLRFARDFGCSIVGTETGSPLVDSGFTKEIYLEKTFMDFIISLKILVREAEKTGSIVAIEGVADKNCIFSHERLKRTIELIPSPNLGIIYDPVNFLPLERASESDFLMKEAFQLFAHKMVAIHAKDYTMKDGVKNGTLPSGKGELNYPLLFDLIKHYKPWIHVVLENNNRETMSETVAFIHKVKREIK
jgi:sugar phosphate isomerase/epimerase